MTPPHHHCESAQRTKQSIFLRKESGRFFKKKLRKKLLPLVLLAIPQPVMAAKAAIHAFAYVPPGAVDGRFRGHDGLKRGQSPREQKSFAELFFRKATACLGYPP